MAERRVLQPWEREALRVCNTDLLRDIVNDNRPAPVAAPSTNVTVVGSGRVQDFDYGPKYRPYRPPEDDNATTTDRSGWKEGRPLRPPEGINYVDALCDQADAIDRAERLRKLTETAAIRRAEAALKQRDEDLNKKPKGGPQK